MTNRRRTVKSASGSAAATPGRAGSKGASRSAGLRRGLEILCLFSDGRPEWGVSEIARALGVHKSRAHRAIKTLEDMGFVRKNPASRRYSMGIRAFEVGSLAGRLTNSMAWARYDLQQLARRLQATVSLRLVVDDDLLVVDMIESRDQLQHMPQGARVPLNYGAGGQVLAAFRKDESVRALIRRHGLPRYTAKSLTLEGDFMDAVRRARRQGYAVSEGETIPGSFSVAAPITEPGGRLIAVVVASRMLKGMSRAAIEAFSQAVVDAAAAISRRCVKAA